MGALLLVAATILAPRIVGSSCNACVSEPKVELSTLKNLLDEFKMDNGRYPTREEGLRALVIPPPGFRGNWRRAYQGYRLRRDYWNHPYAYESDGRSLTLTTLGADGRPGGQGENADLMVTD